MVLLREKRGSTAAARWEKEVVGDSLFGFQAAALKKVKVIAGDLETLEGIRWPEGQAPTTIIHCAANVKTLDTYANLYRDNVIGVQRLCDAAVAWGSTRLLLLSTCYVHPRSTVGGSELLSKDLPRELFTTDYTYTKYLGEHIANGYKGHLKITLLRLSCVGAPAGWLDAHPTPSAMAHLGIVSLLIRQRIRMLCLPSTAQLSTVPVDLVASQIVNEFEAAHTSDSLRVKQLCAAPTDPVWNLSLARLFKTLQRLAPALDLQLLDCAAKDTPAELRKRFGWSSWTPTGYKSLRFHEEVNVFVSQFADGQRFETSIPADAFPNTTQEAVYEQTCIYVARGIHQYRLERGVSKPALDSFWGSMSDHTIQFHLRYRNHVAFNTSEEAEERVANVFNAYRLGFVNPEESSRYLIQPGSTGSKVSWEKDGSGTFKPSPHPTQPIELHIVGDISGGVVGINGTFHHGLGDGVSYMTISPRAFHLDKATPTQTMEPTTARSKPLSWTQEFFCLVMYLAFIVRFLLKDVGTPSEKRVERSFAKTTTHFKKRPGSTFTSSILEQAYPAIRSTLHKEEIVYAVPALVESPADRGLSLPKNGFVTVLIPWTAGSAETSKLFLRSKVVRTLCWCLCTSLGATGLTSIRDYFMNRVDCVVSSILGSDTAIPTIESFHFHAPTPAEIPFTLSLMTLGADTHLTVASTHGQTTAGKLMSEILTNQ